MSYVFIIAPCSMTKAALFPKLGPFPFPRTMLLQGGNFEHINPTLYGGEGSGMVKFCQKRPSVPWLLTRIVDWLKKFQMFFIFWGVEIKSDWHSAHPTFVCGSFPGNFTTPSADLWFEFADFQSEVHRCCGSGNWLSSGWDTPSDGVAISLTVGMVLFTQEVDAMEPARVPLPGLNRKEEEQRWTTCYGRSFSRNSVHVKMKISSTLMSSECDEAKVNAAFWRTVR